MYYVRFLYGGLYIENHYEYQNFIKNVLQIVRFIKIRI